MKKLKTIAMAAVVAAVFMTTLVISVGSNSTLIASVRADDDPESTGTGEEGIWKPVTVDIGHWEGTGADRHRVHDKYGTCCGNGTDLTCTPVDCP